MFEKDKRIVGEKIIPKNKYLKQGLYVIVRQNFSQFIVPKIAPRNIPKIDQKINPKNKYLKQGLHVIVRQNFSQFIGLIDVWFIIKKVDNVQNIFELLASISWGISEK
jgi:hypothetical protein